MHSRINTLSFLTIWNYVKFICFVAHFKVGCFRKILSDQYDAAKQLLKYVRLKYLVMNNLFLSA